MIFTAARRSAERRRAAAPGALHVVPKLAEFGWQWRSGKGGVMALGS